MSEVSARLSGLSAEKLKLLAGRLKKAGEASPGGGKAPGGIKRLPRDAESFPLSFEQERLWFIDQLEPGNPAFNNSMAVRHHWGVAETEQGLNDIIRRHEILRSSVKTVNGQPAQVFAPSLRLKMGVIDLRGLPQREREARAAAVARRESRRPFDLSAGPLVSGLMVLLGERDNILVCTLHHTVSDGFSMSVFQKELHHFLGFNHRLRSASHPEINSLLETFASGRHSRLPELPIQYADYAAWQREHLQGEPLDVLMSYWKKRLEGLSALSLPTDRPRGAAGAGAGAGARRSVLLSSELTRALGELSQRESATLFMTLLAAFKVLLYRYSGQTDVTVGSPIAGRNKKEAEDLIGFFVNMLVLRTDVAAGLSFRDVLGRVKDVCLGAYAHQEMPFGMLVKELNPDRDLGMHPLFQVGFQLNTTPSSYDMQTDERGVPRHNSGMWLDTQSAVFNLNLTIDRMTSDTRGEKKGLADDGLRCVLEYDTALFEPETVERMVKHYERLLEKIVEDADRKIEEIDILADEEKRRLLVEWNDTAADYERAACVHELFEAQARTLPDRIAVSYEDEQVTYAELNRRANRLAHYLRSKGVGPESLVGLCVDRSIGMAVSLLGILKAGGAYLPLDASYPEQRLHYMLGGAGARLIVAQEGLEGVAAGFGGEVVCLERDGELIDSFPGSDPAALTTPDNLAYVMYTSGSTGLPKGVAVTHSNVVRLVRQDRFATFGADEVVLGFAPVSFDASTFEVWGALANGGRLEAHTAGPATLEGLGRTIRERRVSTMWLTAELFHQVVDSRLEDLRGVRQLLAGGDVLSVRHAEAAAVGLLPGGRLINGYGPTEGTTFSTSHWIKAGEGVGRGIPIGRPIANAQTYITGRGELAPTGATGDLLIGGDGLARGYLNRPELTAEKFTPDPFGSTPGARLYRTGDLARYRSDGNIEFLGRADEQVKIRGFRIELGEIETTLASHPSVHETVVTTRDDFAGNKRLVAYVVCDPGVRAAYAEPNPSDEHASQNPPRGSADRSIRAELRSYLQSKLPEYMIPSTFVLLDSMPLTPNGKVDRRALPSPDAARTQPDEAFVEPSKGTEQLLAEIWAQVLRLERVGVHDNFFELGGDSILAIQIISKANQAGLQLSPRQIFQNQTIAELALAAGATLDVEAEQTTVEGAVQLTPVQHWFFEQGLADAHHFNQSRMLEVHRQVESGLLKRVLKEIVNHHDALRLRYRLRDGAWEQSNAAREDGEVFVEIDLSGTPREQQAQALKEEAARIQSGLDLQDGPIVRAALINLGEEGGRRLLIVVHHLAVDGISWRILLEDIQKGYEQAKRGEIDLGRKATSFRQWSERLREYAQGEAVKAEAAYWLGRKRTASAPALPLDHEVGENTVESARNVVTWLDEDETRALLQDVPAAYRTQINDSLLAALALAYREWAGDGSLLIDLEGHGREEVVESADITRTVGWFTTIYPVLLDVGAGAGLGEGIKRVKEQLRGIPNKGIGYGLLKYLSGDEEVRAKLRAGREPEIVFNYLGQLGQSAGQTGIFGLAREGAGPTRSERQGRDHLLEVNGGVLGGRLQMIWTYSENLHRRETIEALAGAYKKWLKAIIEHCASPDAGGYTPSDFPLSGLNQEQLDALIGGDRNVEDVYKLSPMQEGLLFHSLYKPEDSTYLVQMSVAVDGEVNREELERSWQAVAEKNEGMRARFIWEGVEQPVQVIMKRAAVPVEYKDWTGKNVEEQRAEFERFLLEDRRRGFDLKEAPLMRVTLIRKAEKAYQWVWSYHHIMMDGWSMPIVLGQLSGKADESGGARPYRDYIEWLQKQDIRKAEGFWRESLRGFAEPTRLGVEKLAEAAGAGEAGHGEERVWMSREACESLERAAREHRLTVNTVVQGGWSLLLSRYSGERDVVYGATVSGRPADLAGMERVVGLFINTLPVRAEVRADETAAEWLKRLQDQQSEMRQYEYSPLVEVQGWSDVPRGEPLFETIFAYENYPMIRSLKGGASQGKGEGAKVREMRSIERTNYPLSVVAVPGEGMMIKIIYDKSRYEQAAVRRIIKHYERLLESLAQGLGRRVSEIDILTPEERRQVVEEWNDTAAEYEKDCCIHELFEERAREAADRVAVSYEDEQVTYGELNARANRLAHYLKGVGVGPESLVGVCVDRSVGMVVSLLGILKAGGAYLPLDPQYPKQRLQYMLDDARVKLLVTTEALSEELGGLGAGRQVILLDSDWPKVAAQGAHNPARQADPRNAAYVIYTSGSTGAPKGVMVEHGGACNMAEAQMKNFGVGADSCVLQFASLSFDASIFEIIMGQKAGARLCLAAKERLLPGPSLVELLTSRAVTHVTIPPSALTLVPEDSLPGVRTIIVAGESCSEDLAARWGRTRRFFNAYGPTEATVWSSLLECAGYGTPTIGRPISNVQMYILDKDHNPAPVGARGEIYIAGDGLARGYVGRAELTAERFIPNAYGRAGGARLYKTGDLGRYRADGEIEFLGRADDQVKVRGYRIELGEIEAALREYEAVADCVVVVRDAEGGEKRLVGYVVTRGEGEASVSGLKSFLRERLPEYMIPAAFVTLDAIPLTANGKIDRRALPEPKGHGLKLGEVYVPPRNEAEEVITAIWQEVLKVEKIGINDNFFDLGGHSLLMIRAHNKLREAFGTSMQMVEMFRHPTVRGMAAHLSEAGDQDSSFERGQSRARMRKKMSRRQKQSKQPAGGE